MPAKGEVKLERVLLVVGDVNSDDDNDNHSSNKSSRRQMSRQRCTVEATRYRNDGAQSKRRVSAKSVHRLGDKMLSARSCQDDGDETQKAWATS